MIGRLTGTLLDKQPPWIWVDVGGVGYELEAPMSTIFRLPAPGEEVRLHVHLSIRDDAHLLYGFATADEKTLFRELIRVSGVGPKLALAILSGIGVEEFWECARNDDTAQLTRIPGIGRKTAQRLLVEMRDRAGAIDAPAAAGTAATPPGPMAEARAALVALGYKPAEVQRMTADLGELSDAEAIIRAALKRAIQR